MSTRLALPKFLPSVWVVAIVLLADARVFSQQSAGDDDTSAPVSEIKLPIRNELGKRVRRFEKQWQISSDADRLRSTDSMELAVKQFFGLQLENAAQSLDVAFLSLAPDKRTQLETLVPLFAIPTQTIYDSTPDFIELRIDRLYSNPSANPKKEPASTVATSTIPKLVVRLHARSPKGEEQQTIEQTYNDVSIPTTLKLDLGLQRSELSDAANNSDWQAEIVADQDGVSLPIITAGFSIIDQAEQRSETWTRWIESNRDGSSSDAASHELATARLYSNWLRSARKNIRGESDLPYAHLASVLDALCNKKTLREIVPLEWLQLRHQRQQQVVRIRPPRESTSPWVVAMHGAGGSENMFFETYGAGRLVDLAAERGWGVISPRLGLGGVAVPLEATLDELANVWNAKPSHVFLVGHSMGAGQVVAQSSQFPERVSAAVAVGGGGAPRISKELKNVPFWIAAGERDFGKRGAEALFERLKSANVPSQWRVYPGIEHMVIMQATLDDVFLFLDGIAGRPGT